MDKKKPVSIKPADDSLRKKIGTGSLADLFTAKQIAAGQQTIEDFKDDFFQQLKELEEHFNLKAGEPIDVDTLYESSKSLKGQSETLGFIFLSEIGTSLYKFLEYKRSYVGRTAPSLTDLEKIIIQKHCEAILHAIKNEERGKGGMVEAEIVSYLNLLVNKVSK